MLISMLVIGVLALGFLQSSVSDKAAMFLFGLIHLSFIPLVPYIPDPAYFVAGALGDLLFIILLVGISPITKTCMAMAAIGFSGILINAFGYINYMNGNGSEVYNNLYLITYIAAAFVAMISGSGNGEDYGSRDHWITAFRFDNNSWFGRIKGYIQKAES